MPWELDLEPDLLQVVLHELADALAGRAGLAPQDDAQLLAVLLAHAAVARDPAGSFKELHGLLLSKVEAHVRELLAVAGVAGRLGATVANG